MFPQDKQNLEATEILALGDIMAVHGGQRIALDTIRKGGNTRAFMEAMIRESKLRSTDKAADALLGIDSGAPELRGYSISRALKASLEVQVGIKDAWNNAGLERDISSIAATRSNSVANGFFVPMGLLARDFNVGTASQAGNLLGAAVDGNHVADPLRRVSVIGGLGATILSGLKFTTTLPRFVSSTDAAFKPEIGAATQITETTVAAVLTPKRIPVQMTLSRQALLQATPQLDAAISRQLYGAIMEQIDYGALNGDGTNDTPVGVRSTGGIGSVVGGTDGVQLTYTHLADLEKAPADADAAELQTGFAVNSATRRWLRTKPKATGLDFCWENSATPLLGHRALVSNSLPSNLTKGASSGVCSSVLYSADWAELVVGIYGGGVDILLDRFTVADQGKVKITASLLVGVGVNLPGAFAKMDDALTG